MNGWPARSRVGLLVPSFFALATFLVFFGLGTWQLQRKAWKEALVGVLEQRLSATPVALPGRETWSMLNPVESEFRRVKFLATYLEGEALVYASASALRTDVKGVGYWVLSPVRLALGGYAVVNRGFVPEGRQDPATRPAASEVAGPLELMGVMRWPEARGSFVPMDDPTRNLWFVRDPGRIAAAKGWGEVAPFYVELESPQPLGGLPRAGKLVAHLRNDHLQYAATWYGLALVVIVMFGCWLSGRSRAVAMEGAKEPDPPKRRKG